MIVIPLQSGSNGNCIYVEAGGAKLLFDAGISGKQAQQRLAEFGRDITEVDAVLISHDHSDHIRCAGVYQRKFGLPVYVSPPTLTQAQRYCDLGKLMDVTHFESGQQIAFGNAFVRTIRTPHDAADGVAFVVGDGSRSLGIFTDLGHPFAGLGEALGQLDAVFLESNYDPRMLDNGPYPQFLKQRIKGPHGHISNAEAAALLRDWAGGRLKWAVLSHLSEQNNTPQVCMQTHEAILSARFPLQVASRFEATGLFEV